MITDTVFRRTSRSLVTVVVRCISVNDSAPPSQRPIRVLLTGYHQIVLAGLRLLLEREGFTVVGGGTSDGPQRADVIVIDIDGRADDLLTALSPDVPAGARRMMLGSVIDASTLALALRHGITGVVLKGEPPHVFLEAVRHIADGEIWLDRASTAHLVAGLSGVTPSLSREANRSEQLTRREREVVGLIGRGLRNQIVADQLHVSEVTVRNHLTAIYRKLNVRSRLQLAIYALTHGLCKLPQKLRLAQVSTTSRRKKTAS